MTPDTNQAGTGPGSLAYLSARHGPRYRWLLLMSVMVGTVASVMSATVVNVAIPDLSQHFAITQERVQWVGSGFMVAMTVSMLLTPWLLARFGYRATYVSSMMVLLAGGVGGGLAGSFEGVLAARVAEGLAAGILQPIPAIIIFRAFERHEHGRATALFGMGVVLAPAIGPGVGGLLVDWFGWRSIFFMIVPFCLLSITLAYRYVPKNAPGGASPASTSLLDWKGLMLAVTGTLCLLNALTEMRSSPWPLTAALLGSAGVAAIAFLAWQRHLMQLGRQPLMDLSLFKYRSFAMGSLVSFIYGAALFGSTYLLPVYMQLGLGLSATLAGGILLPAGFVLAVTIGLVGRSSARVPVHVFVAAGLGILTLSFVLTPTAAWGSTLWLLTGWTILGRIGLGFILPSLNIGAIRPVEKALITQAASVISFLRMLGGAIGVGGCAIFLEWRVAAHGASLATTATSPGSLAAFNETFFSLAALCAVAVVAAWRMREDRS